MNVTARRNVAALRTAYLAALNRCFDAWGGAERYRWCFERRVGPLSADVIVLERDGDLVAGSAVTYRPLRLPSGARVQAGIMTGSFTLPEERGRGHFTRLVQESRAAALERGAGLLLAFVTETNASCHVLAAARARMLRTHYVFSSAGWTGDARCRIEPAEEESAADGLAARGSLAPAPTGAVRFLYSPDEWKSQFVERSLPVERIRVDEEPALVERSEEFDHVLFLWPRGPADEVRQLAGLAGRAARHGRRLRTFTASQPLADACAAAGFELHGGRLAILPTDARPGASAPDLLEWSIHSGDRM